MRNKKRDAQPGVSLLNEKKAVLMENILVPWLTIDLNYTYPYQFNLPQNIISTIYQTEEKSITWTNLLPLLETSV